jgi:Sulfotransferase domain
MADIAQLESREDHFRALGFGRHYDNLPWIGEGDIIVPTAAGAGSSLLAALLLELNLHYVDLTKEVLLPDGSSVPLTDSITRRLDTGAAYDRDAASERDETGRHWRFMKTHLPQEELPGVAFSGVWILVRDPRDAIYSWHRYHLSFAEAEWERVPESFEEFLRQPFFTGDTPVGNWSSFYEGWLARAESCEYVAILRFEDLKRDPLRTMRSAFETIELDVPEEELRRAIERSSYDAMRANEDAVAASDSDRPKERIMRRGKVGEWEEWMTPELARCFSGDEVRSVARRFGYSLPET